ncbi:MAG: ribosome small subunit-dependent GTPase A [Clostridiales bacterium]|nr:ribosome small subunit-dependent GTPase A [Clostridiales bacterium]
MIFIHTPFILPPRFQGLAEQYAPLIPARITAQQRGLYRIHSSKGSENAQVSGKFLHETLTPSDFPTVGDYVMVDENGIIHHVLPRQSVFIRKASGNTHSEQAVAANIDTLFLCMSINNDFNLRRLERYLSAAWSSGAEPVVVLTKADLCDDPRLKMLEVESIASGATILLTSSLADDGVAQLLPRLTPGRTVAFLGSSGVGKSTLINRLLGEELLQTGGLRNDDKGHHTTTHREMFMLPSGAMVIDTPGMRELGMWDSSEGISSTFADIEELFSSCRFRDCTHQSEPGCAVKASLQSGALSQDRWQSYQRLMKENAYAEDSEGYLASKKRLFIEISKFSKANKKR